MKTEIVADYSDSFEDAFVVMHYLEYQNLYDLSLESFNCLIRDIKINSFAFPSSRYHILHQNLVEKKGNGDLSNIYIERLNSESNSKTMVAGSNLIRMLSCNND